LFTYFIRDVSYDIDTRMILVLRTALRQETEIIIELNLVYLIFQKHRQQPHHVSVFLIDIPIVILENLFQKDVHRGVIRIVFIHSSLNY